MTEPNKPAEVTVGEPPAGLPPGTYSNYFFTAWLGNQIEIMFAFVDPVLTVRKRDVATRSGVGAIEIQPEVVGRLIIPGDAFPYLLTQLLDIAKRAPFPIAPPTP
jgi:hypothetical protein